VQLAPQFKVQVPEQLAHDVSQLPKQPPVHPSEHSPVQLVHVVVQVLLQPVQPVQPVQTPVQFKQAI